MASKVRPTVTMETTTEVVLLDDQQLLFPESCVGCCGPAETSRRHRSVKTGGWLHSLGCSMPGPAWWVPYCHACAMRTRRRLLILRFTGLPLFFLTLMVTIVFTRSMGLGAFWMPLALALAIGLAFPIFFWGAAWRPPFDAMASGGKLRCYFRSREYARSFMELNKLVHEGVEGPDSRGCEAGSLQARAEEMES